MAGAVWPRARKYDSGFVPSPLCPRCHAQPETLHHRIWQCIGNIDDNGSNQIVARTAHLVDEAAASNEAYDIFSLRGLPPLAWYSVGPPQDECEKFVMGDTYLPDGEYFSDGSGGRFTSDVRLRRCGWSFAHVIFEEYRRVQRIAHGTFGALPGPRQMCPEQSYTQRCNLLRRSNPATQLDALCCGLIATMSGALQRGGGSNLAVPTQTCGNSFSIYVVL